MRSGRFRVAEDRIQGSARLVEGTEYGNHRAEMVQESQQRRRAGTAGHRRQRDVDSAGGSGEPDQHKLHHGGAEPHGDDRPMGLLAARNETGALCSERVKIAPRAARRRAAERPDDAGDGSRGPFREGTMDGAAAIHGHAGLPRGAEAAAGGLPFQRHFVLQPPSRGDRQNATGGDASRREKHPLY